MIALTAVLLQRTWGWASAPTVLTWRLLSAQHGMKEAGSTPGRHRNMVCLASPCWSSWRAWECRSLVSGVLNSAHWSHRGWTASQGAVASGAVLQIPSDYLQSTKYRLNICYSVWTGNKLKFKFKRKIWTWARIWTSDFQISSLALEVRGSNTGPVRDFYFILNCNSSTHKL